MGGLAAVLFFHPVLNPYPRLNAVLLAAGALAALLTIGG